MAYWILFSLGIPYGPALVRPFLVHCHLCSWTNYSDKHGLYSHQCLDLPWLESAATFPQKCQWILFRVLQLLGTWILIKAFISFPCWELGLIKSSYLFVISVFRAHELSFRFTWECVYSLLTSHKSIVFPIDSPLILFYHSLSITCESHQSLCLHFSP